MPAYPGEGSTYRAMNHFCTYFDRRYLVRGLALHESLMRHCPDAVLHILCLDDTVFEILTSIDPPGIDLVDLATVERAEPRLATVKGNRGRIEYYFTLTPILVDWFLRRLPDGELLTYLDADLYFYESPAPILASLATASIGLVPHRFPEKLRENLKYGRFNVGWLSFRHDETGLRCLDWYRDRCLEWCYDVVEPDRFADQKYLDRIPELFAGVTVIEHPGANLAPWNVDGHRLGWANGRVTVDDKPVIFFHLQGVKHLAGRVYDAGLWPYRATLSDVLRDGIYLPYLASLDALAKTVPGDAGPPDEFSIRGKKTTPLHHVIDFAGAALRYPRLLRQLIRLGRTRTWLIMPGR